MKNKSISNNFFTLYLLVLFCLLVGCGTNTSTGNDEINTSGRIEGVSKNIENNKKSISESIDAILNKDNISTADVKEAYELINDLEQTNSKQAKQYLSKLKYCMYGKDAYGIADDEYIFGHTAEEAEELINGNYYGTWYIHKTGEDEMFSFTEETINGRAYYVRSVYTDYSIMVIYGYMDEPDKLYCLEMDSQYCTYENGSGELILYVNYSKDYVPGLSYMDASWCNFDKAIHSGILNAYNEYMQKAWDDTRNFQIHEGNISNKVIPSYEGADTTEIEGDGTYFDEIVSGAWFDEYGQPIAKYMPQDLTEKLFFDGYYAELKHLHFIDGSNMTLDYVKRYGYSTDVVFDEIYAMVITDVYKFVTDNGKNYFQGTEYYSGEPVVIWGSFSGLLNGDSVMIIGPFNGLATDDTANFTGVWCEIINNRFGESASYNTGYSEWWEDDIGNHGTSDVYNDYENYHTSTEDINFEEPKNKEYDMYEYVFSDEEGKTPVDFFENAGLRYEMEPMGRGCEYYSTDIDAWFSTYADFVECYVSGDNSRNYGVTVYGLYIGLEEDEVYSFFEVENLGDDSLLLWTEDEAGYLEISFDYGKISELHFYYSYE